MKYSQKILKMWYYCLLEKSDRFFLTLRITPAGKNSDAFTSIRSRFDGSFGRILTEIHDH